MTDSAFAGKSLHIQNIFFNGRLVYGIQNDRTEHTDSAKNGNVLACLRAEIFVKMCQNQAVWFGWGFLGSFFAVFSATRQARTFQFFLLSPCVLCGHFEYHKPNIR